MELIKDFPKAVKNIRNELKNYIIENNLRSLVLGISGGIDSALTAALAYPVCLELKIPLFGRSLTIQTNKKDEISRAALVGKSYTTDFREVDLSQAFLQLKPFVIEEIDKQDNDNNSYKIRLGNIKARIRMIYLYELASKNKGLVLSTDNYTELLLGFWTLHGDVGDFAMIQMLWKTEVYEMAKYIRDSESNDEQAKALDACIKAVPTDGLGITNSDLEQLKAKSYMEVDEILMKYLETKDESLKSHPVIQRHLNSAFKRENPFILNRQIYFK